MCKTYDLLQNYGCLSLRDNLNELEHAMVVEISCIYGRDLQIST